MGISGARNVARPISTVTAAMRPPAAWQTHSTMPPLVSTVNVVDFAWPCSERYLAKIRSPLPDFSASLPSGLKMRRPKSALALGTRSRIPSEPTPRLRSQIRRIALADSPRGTSCCVSTR